MAIRPAAPGAPRPPRSKPTPWPRTTPPVEAALAAESRDSARVAELLGTAAPWSRWPERLRRALMAAVTEEGDGPEA